MIKSRTTQLIFQAFFIAFGIVGIVASIGVFDDVKNLNTGFYVYFTNISNYLCIGIMLTQLIETARKKEDSYVSSIPVVMFVGVLSILLTFFVFNLLLAGEATRDPQANWKPGSLLFHVVMPIMFVLDWVLFYEHGKVKWFWPFVSLSFPILYCGFIYSRAAMLNFDPAAPLLYPYFFLDVEKQHLFGVAKWIGILLVAFVIMGYAFYGLDRLLCGKKEVTAKNEKR